MSNELQLTAVGNIASDPELNYRGNQHVCTFSMAVNHRKYDRQQNEYVDAGVTFLRVQAWRELGEHAYASLEKGSRIIVQGSLENRQYEDKEGNTRYSLELTADAIGPDLRFHVAQPVKPTSTPSTKQSSAPKASPFQKPAAPIESRLEEARSSYPEPDSGDIDPDDIPF